jgi:hypothetical protein
LSSLFCSFLQFCWLVVYTVSFSTSKWWDRGLKIFSIVFGVIGFVYFSVGLISYLSIDDFRSDPELRNFDSELQNSIIESSYFYGALLTVSGVIAFVAIAGLSMRRKFGWYML